MEWSAAIPVLFGGAITLVTSLVVMLFGNMLDRKKVAESEKKNEAAKVVSGFLKLVSTENIALNLSKYIDSEFEEARNSGLQMENPSEIVRPMYGEVLPLERVMADESSFLLRIGKEELLSKIWEIQNRVLAAESVFEKFNLEKAEYGKFLESKVSSMGGLNTHRAAYELEGDDARLATIYIGRLNSLIGNVIANLEDDKHAVKKVVEDFYLAAKSEFGDDFPFKKIEWSF